MTFGVVVLGATGFTGRLACEYLANRGGSKVAWAMAGRDLGKLEALRKDLPEAAKEVTLLKVDVKNEEELKDVAKKTKVILNFAGTPYFDKALPVVEACVSSGCCYVDITGEVPFMKTSADRYDAKAREAKALILHSCGFDSIPCDMAAWMAATAMRERHGMACAAIRNAVMDAAGGASGGTIYSGLGMLTQDVENKAAMMDPYGMDPPDGQRGPDTADGGTTDLPRWDELQEKWLMISPLSNPSCRTVRRSNALLGYPYGQGLSYGEGIVVPGPVSGWLGTMALGFMVGSLYFPPTRWALKRWVLPEPGQGPSRKAMEEGRFTVRAVALGEKAKSDGQIPKVVAKVDSVNAGDPGYKATALMSVETALCCALERGRCAEGGVMTPAAGLGQVLVDRLNAAGMKLEVEP
ncbi:unnamed protein product [Effrenium voratum]|uniref:Saccharopine dehydrogenase NADP binding domain-containing protein n=2 Tax=Effrenium voratum TaxID=2562239 RepID=A0AA36JFV1_9DINO|nr:unnamed protein product [Effrenium voratum]CAJ1437374.1 unnamed protein product [Effrenium voratum]